MNVGIFGLGYVGLVNMVCLAKLGHKITGVDIKQFKVDLINSGNTPIYEPEISDLLNSGLKSGLIKATIDPKEAVINSEVVLICVGTPSQSSGEVNLDYTINTTIDICKCLKGTDKFINLVYRSTIPPRTINEIMIPEIKNILGDTYSQNVSISFLPEFLREGSAVSDFFHGARVVIGNDDSKNDDLVRLFSYENSNIITTDIITSEFVKYVDNSFHALKVAFANEVYSLGEKYEIDTRLANEIFLSDDVLNISKYYLKPGLPFGGSCLPKDLRAIYAMASQNNMDIPLLPSIMESNHVQQNKLLNKVLGFGKSKIALYGLAFKNDTDDVRESPLLGLAKGLIENNIDLKVYDPHINLNQLRQDFPWIAKYIVNQPEEISSSEVLVVAKKECENVLRGQSDDSIIFNLMLGSLPNMQDKKYKVHNLY